MVGQPGRTQQGVATCQEAIGIDPSNDRAYRVLSRIHTKLGNAKEAIQAAKKGIELDKKSAENWLALGHAYFGCPPLCGAETAEVLTNLMTMKIHNQEDTY